MLGFSVSELHTTPSEFWGMTMCEFWSAFYFLHPEQINTKKDVAEDIVHHFHDPDVKAKLEEAERRYNAHKEKLKANKHGVK